MSRIIPSPAKCWPGQVILPDALNFPQYIAWQDALDAATQLRARPDETLTVGELAASERLAHAMLPGVIACVEKWELKNFPANVSVATFPATPREASFGLLLGLIAEITKLVTEADAVPNE